MYVKKVLATTLGLLLAGATAAYAAPVTDFEKGAVTIELGSTLGSKFEGKTNVPLGLPKSVDGKSGFKYGVAVGMGNDYALQYKGGKFKSEDFNLGGSPIHGKSDLQELNVIHKINPNLSLVGGWVQNKISYSRDVKEATKAAVHAGFVVSQPLNETSKLFASYLGGKNAAYLEAGIAFKVAKNSEFAVSYAEREFKDLPVASAILPPGVRADYKLKGISCVISTKL